MKATYNSDFADHLRASMINCIYCQQELKAPAKNCDYWCTQCTTSFRMSVDNKMIFSTLYFRMGWDHYCKLVISYPEGHCYVYSLTTREMLFALSHIPDWTPNNIADKVSNLLMFL